MACCQSTQQRHVRFLFARHRVLILTGQQPQAVKTKSVGLQRATLPLSSLLHGQLAHEVDVRSWFNELEMQVTTADLFTIAGVVVNDALQNVSSTHKHLAQSLVVSIKLRQMRHWCLRDLFL